MSFTRFKFEKPIAENIAACGYTEPTPIQQQAIPKIIEGKDVLGLAQTGTGKTAAFVLPLIQKLLTTSGRGTRVLILAPTRELAQQTHTVICQMTEHTTIRSAVVFGGVGKQPQIKALRDGVDCIVACPGRLLDVLNERGVSLKEVDYLVLDEADQMLDKGFLPDIKKIVSRLPAKRQSLVFSATMPGEIRHLVDDILKNPVTIQINHSKPINTISHKLMTVGGRVGKTPLLKTLLGDQEKKSVVVFTRTKHKARSLAGQLERSGFKAVAIQGNLSQLKRQQAMDGFRAGTYSVLVATDIAARGIDVSGVSHVINYDVPDTVETYTHRTGRTGRASLTGEAITFAENKDKSIVIRIEKTLGFKMTREHLAPLEKYNVLSSGSGKKTGNFKPKGPAGRKKTYKSKKRSGHGCSV